MILKNFQDNYFFQCSPFDYFGRGKCERQFPPRGSNLPHTQHSIPRRTIPHLRAQGPKGWMGSNGRTGGNSLELKLSAAFPRCKTLASHRSQ